MQPKHFKTSMWSWQLCFTSNKHHLICLLHARKKHRKGGYCMVLSGIVLLPHCPWMAKKPCPAWPAVPHSSSGQSRRHCPCEWCSPDKKSPSAAAPRNTTSEKCSTSPGKMKTPEGYPAKPQEEAGIYSVDSFIKWNQKVHEAGRPAWLWFDAFDH